MLPRILIAITESDLTFDQRIQLWIVLGTWFAGIATFLAVVVALYLARHVEKVRLKAHAGLRVLFLGDGSPRQEHLDIAVTNIGERSVTLVNVGWRVGTRKNRRYCIQTVSGPHTSQLPVELTHGKTANFMVSFDVTSNWKKEFAQGFVKDLSDKSLKTLRALIDTSVGQTIEVRPEQDLLEEIKKAREC